jgi:hypothetical protein
MALTVVHSPTKYNFSRNPHFVVIETDNISYLANEGEKAKTYFVFHNAVNNDTISVVIGGSAAGTITFKAATNYGLNQIAYKAGGESVMEFAVRFANDLLQLGMFSSNYEAAIEGVSVILTAKVGGTAFSMAGSTTTASLSYIQAWKTGTDLLINRDRLNYGIGIALYAETEAGSFVYTNIYTGIKTPSNNKVQFDLANIINAVLDYDIPEFTLPLAPFWAKKVCKRFYVKIWEQFGEPSIPQGTTLSGMTVISMDGAKFISDKYYVLKAGFDKTSWRILSEEQFNYYATHSAFLTRQPRVKVISAGQIEWLYYLFNAAPVSTARLRYRLYNKLGQMTETNILPSAAGVLAGHVWGFPVNYSQGYLTQNAGYVKMEVCLVQSSSGSEISETFTYLLDERQRLDERFLYFTNADGGLDTVRLTGVQESAGDFEREVVERTLTAEDTDEQGDAEVLYAEKNNSFVGFSGWKTQAEMNYIEDLLLSRKAFTFGNEFGQNVKVPIIITSKKLVRKRTNRNLKGYVIEYRDAIRDELPQATHYPVE